ncbi:MAG: AzlD domain-containing protein [Rhodospirillales bacterium]|nr:AzlD domain-containing protein [Rhodospirillales bacterium]
MQESWLWPLAVLAVAALATYVWRFLGVLLSGRINPESAFFAWMASVAYALLAGLVTRMIVLPVGPLIETPLAARLTAAAVCLFCFLITRRLLPSVLIGGGSLALWLSLSVS